MPCGSKEALINHCIAERTFSLAFGRGAYTFGSVPTVMTDVYTIPKSELSVKMYPQNITVMPEPNRIPPDCFQFAGQLLRRHALKPAQGLGHDRGELPGFADRDRPAGQ